LAPEVFISDAHRTQKLAPENGVDLRRWFLERVMGLTTALQVKLPEYSTTTETSNDKNTTTIDTTNKTRNPAIADKHT